MSWAYVLTIELPDEYDEDEPAKLAGVIRQIADEVEDYDLPPTGKLWDDKGQLLADATFVEEDDS